MYGIGVLISRLNMCPQSDFQVFYNLKSVLQYKVLHALPAGALARTVFLSTQMRCYKIHALATAHLLCFLGFPLGPHPKHITQQGWFSGCLIHRKLESRILKQTHLNSQNTRKFIKHGSTACDMGIKHCIHQEFSSWWLFCNQGTKIYIQCDPHLS